MCLSVPGQIVSIESSDPLARMGKVSFSGILKPINLSFVPDAQVGDFVLAHVGFAISIINEKAANEVLELYGEKP